jgi:Protein of unknown function (DUF3616)
MLTAFLSHHSAWKRNLAAVIFTSMIGCSIESGSAGAETKLKPEPAKWKVSEPFKKSPEARSNLSGAACAPKTPPFKFCVVVNDQKKYAQFFSIDGTVMVPGKVIRLVDDSAGGDPDAEGAAYDDGKFYITGSHGRSRNHPDDHNESSYVVLRFSVDKTTGEPTFPVSEDKVVGVEPSHRLRDVLKDKLSGFFDKPLDPDGANIEGIAVQSGRMYLGLRGPSDNGTAFIISVDAEAMFTPGRDLDALVKPLALGPSTGIRDLAAVSGGLLVLSGPVNKQAVTPAVRHWNPKTEVLGAPANLELPNLGTELKAETLLILRDADAEPWRALLIFEGPPDGAPTEYLIPRSIAAQ